jgi:predicted dehydrogenase
VWHAGGEQAPLAIGFNRTLAPLSLELREQLSDVSSPLQVIIRVNAPRAGEHWLDDPDQGGGRLLGEGCHFFDYANWLCGMPLSVSASAARGAAGDRTVQSASVTIGYKNGSVASVHYSALGPASLPKERYEVLAGGRAWVLENFERLTSFEASGSRTVEKGAGDKGHAELMRRVLAACRGERRFQPGLRAAYMAQSVALAALESIASGQICAVTTSG